MLGHDEIRQPLQEKGCDWQAQFAVEHHEVVAVADVLLEPTQVGGQGLVAEVLAIVDRGSVVEACEDPVVHATQVIHQLVLPKRAAACQAVGPDKVAVDAGVLPVVETHDEHVAGFLLDGLVVFGKQFAA